jgi:hypothetical protein
LKPIAAGFLRWNARSEDAERERQLDVAVAAFVTVGEVLKTKRHVPHLQVTAVAQLVGDIFRDVQAGHADGDLTDVNAEMMSGANPPLDSEAAASGFRGGDYLFFASIAFSAILLNCRNVFSSTRARSMNCRTAPAPVKATKKATKATPASKKRKAG